VAGGPQCQTWDVTDLYYYRARICKPGAGRFIREDPMHPGAGRTVAYMLGELASEMTIAYIIFLAVAVITFAMTSRFPIEWRLVLAAAVFLSMSVTLTVWALKIGDEALPDSRTVFPEKKPAEQ
jgi:hypothetical protein